MICGEAAGVFGEAANGAALGNNSKLFFFAQVGRGPRFWVVLVKGVTLVVSA